MVWLLVSSEMQQLHSIVSQYGSRGRVCFLSRHGCWCQVSDFRAFTCKSIPVNTNVEQALLACRSNTTNACPSPLQLLGEVTYLLAFNAGLLSVIEIVGVQPCYVSPLYTEGETYRFTSHGSFLCHISFVSVRSAADGGPASGQH